MCWLEEAVRVQDVLGGSLDGKEVLVRGWLQNKRSSGGIIFLFIRDGSGVVQCTVRKAEVEDWRLELSAGTRHDVFRAFRQVLTWAGERGLCESDPTAGIRNPKRKRHERGEVFPFELSLFEFRTAEGRRFGGSIRDISERREVERLKVTMAAGGPGGAEDDVREAAGIKVLVRGPQEGLDKDAVRALVDTSRRRLSDQTSILKSPGFLATWQLWGTCRKGVSTIFRASQPMAWVFAILRISFKAIVHRLCWWVLRSRLAPASLMSRPSLFD